MVTDDRVVLRPVGVGPVATRLIHVDDDRVAAVVPDEVVLHGVVVTGLDGDSASAEAVKAAAVRIADDQVILEDVVSAGFVADATRIVRVDDVTIVDVPERRIVPSPVGQVDTAGDILPDTVAANATVRPAVSIALVDQIADPRGTGLQRHFDVRVVRARIVIIILAGGQVEKELVVPDDRALLAVTDSLATVVMQRAVLQDEVRPELNANVTVGDLAVGHMPTAGGLVLRETRVDRTALRGVRTHIAQRQIENANVRGGRASPVNLNVRQDRFTGALAVELLTWVRNDRVAAAVGSSV